MLSVKEGLAPTMYLRELAGGARERERESEGGDSMRFDLIRSRLAARSVYGGEARDLTIGPGFWGRTRRKASQCDQRLGRLVVSVI